MFNVIFIISQQLYYIINYIILEHFKVYNYLTIFNFIVNKRSFYLMILRLCLIKILTNIKYNQNYNIKMTKYESFTLIIIFSKITILVILFAQTINKSSITISKDKFFFTNFI